jgi:hypothetical protein
MAAKFYPKMFGDKLDITSDNQKINSTNVVLTDEQVKDAISKL